MNYLSSKSDVSAREAVMAGAASGLVTRFFIAPLDLLKIRIQLRSNPYTPGYLVHTARDIVRKEGVRAFWKGNTPAELLYVTYSSAQFMSLRAINNGLNSWAPTSVIPEAAKQFISGGLAGMTATAVTYPLDFLRTRVAANTTIVPALMSTIKETWVTRGFRGFYLGLGPSLASVFPYMGTFFASYSVLRSAVDSGQAPSWAPSVLSSSAVAAIFSKTVVYPIDTIRKRIQAHGLYELSCKGPTAVHPTFFEMGGTILRTEGVRGMFKGVTIAIFKAAPASLLTVYFYELFLSELRRLNSGPAATS